MARRRLPPGQRKELREARLMVLIGLALVTVYLVKAVRTPKTTTEPPAMERPKDPADQTFG